MAEDAEGWLDLLGSGALQKKVLTPGQGEESKPKEGALVTIEATVYVDGREVEPRHEHAFVTKRNQTRTSWDLVVLFMQLGERARVRTCLRFDSDAKAHGATEESQIEYELVLLEVGEAKAPEELTVPERLDQSRACRERGKLYFQDKEWESAAASFKRALQVLETDQVEDDELELLKEECMLCYNNLGATHLKLEQWKLARESCDIVLDFQPDNVKALFRKAQAVLHLGDADIAVDALKQALKAEPSNVQVRRLLTEASKRKLNITKSEADLARRMLQGLADPSADSGAAEVAAPPVPALYLWLAVASAVAAVAAGVYYLSQQQ